MEGICATVRSSTRARTIEERAFRSIEDAHPTEGAPVTAPRRALVLVDIQNTYFDGPLAIQYPPRDTSLSNITRIIDHAEANGIPVAVVQHTLPAGAPVFAEGSPAWDRPGRCRQ